MLDGEFVLLGEDGAPFLDPYKSKAYLVQGKIWVNNHAHILLARNNKYVKYALNYVDYQRYVTGTTRLKLNQSALKRIIIPFPDENEQKRIVAKIEELFSEIDNAESAITTASGYYKSYEQSIIDSLFAKYEAEAEMVEFGDIAEIKGGITKGRKLRGMPIGETPYLRVANVQDGYLYLDEIKTINVTAEELRKYSLMNGDILFTEGGDKDKLGRGTIWHGEIELCIHQNHIFRARVDSGQFVPEYISYATKTTRARDYFLSKAKQTTNLASLNMTSLKNLQLPSIPLAQQKEIVESIVTKLSEIKSARKELIVAHHRSKALRQSILAKAFKGELV
ncbi:restriction modification system DNA specificity domain [candidate division TM7 genomosp. GTL1]|nr:restriction modification system DNA specificity domain [candidate division TM7 genomosp. GTL1]